MIGIIKNTMTYKNFLKARPKTELVKSLKKNKNFTFKRDLKVKHLGSLKKHITRGSNKYYKKKYLKKRNKFISRWLFWSDWAALSLKINQFKKLNIERLLNAPASSNTDIIFKNLYYDQSGEFGLTLSKDLNDYKLSKNIDNQIDLKFYLKSKLKRVTFFYVNFFILVLKNLKKHLLCFKKQVRVLKQKKKNFLNLFDLYNKTSILNKNINSVFNCKYLKKKFTKKNLVFFFKYKTIKNCYKGRRGRRWRSKLRKLIRKGFGKGLRPWFLRGYLNFRKRARQKLRKDSLFKKPYHNTYKFKKIHRASFKKFYSSGRRSKYINRFSFKKVKLSIKKKLKKTRIHLKYFKNFNKKYKKIKLKKKTKLRPKKIRLKKKIKFWSKKNQNNIYLEYIYGSMLFRRYFNTFIKCGKKQKIEIWFLKTVKKLKKKLQHYFYIIYEEIFLKKWPVYIKLIRRGKFLYRVPYQALKHRIPINSIKTIKKSRKEVKTRTVRILWDKGALTNLIYDNRVHYHFRWRK